jgi:hypothetical protein
VKLFRCAAVAAAAMISVVGLTVAPASAEPAAEPGGPRGLAGSETISVVESAKRHGVQDLDTELAKFAAFERSGQLAPAEPYSCDFITLQSTYNNRYVAAENGGDRRLRARATAVGPWERFELCFFRDGTVDLASADSNRLVSAEVGWAGSDRGTLRARATQSGPWERYILAYYSSPEAVALYSPSSAAGAYVSAEFGWAGSKWGTLRARAGSAGPWEKFR